PRDSSIQIGKFGKSDIWYVDFDAVDQTKKTRFEVQVGVGTETGYTPTSQPSSTPEMSHHCTTPAPKFLGRDSLVYDPERNLFRILIPHSSEFDNAVKSFDLLRYPGFLKDDGSSKKRDEGESDEESSKGKVIFGRL
ncbi:MAG TPA: hypothetical protein PK402_12145, partial [Tepidisphaeraceae bacterium]|nr:hypothetical protein [Tepidisphaeraceae bacterium]